MPYTISWEENGVAVEFSGAFDFEVNKKANCEIWENQRSESIRYAIWDTSGITELLITESELSILAMQDFVGSPKLPNFKMALLAKDKQTQRLFDYYTINYHSRLTRWDFMVSDNMEEIRNWIRS